MEEGKRRIVFLHPDLGIGGAERLVVDAAVGLQNLGYEVTIFTSHCDPKHCFDEARDGTLDVRVRGNSIIPPSFFGRFAILCAILRQIHLIVQITLFTSELRDLWPEAFFVDQLSAGIPLLRLLSFRARILFYCHFPDKLLATRQGWLKQLYRVPFDWLESWTTGCSDDIVVNSNFTRGIFGESFPGLRARNPRVIYPCVDVDGVEEHGSHTKDITSKAVLFGGRRAILSINRFERKKDVGLAIRAFAALEADSREAAILVIAGGYDPRMNENVACHEELETLAKSLGLNSITAKKVDDPSVQATDVDVVFLLSISSSVKSTLLKTSSLLVYTPRHEHFGIVPLEAMLACLPVLAASTGGPRETVVDGETGWLRDTKEVEQWTKVMHKVLRQTSDEELSAFGHRGRSRVIEQFSKAKMAQRIDAAVEEMLKRPRPAQMSSSTLFTLGLVSVLGLLVGITIAHLRRT